MKKSSNGLFEKMSTKQTADLTLIVKETVATGLVQSKGKIFTTADLWNIQRQVKSSAHSSFFV